MATAVGVNALKFIIPNLVAFKGEIPVIRDMVLFEPFDFFIKRKLYVHNMGHATCAYLGLYMGREYIYESIDDLNVQSVGQNAMLESALALSDKYKVPVKDIVKHIQDLLRFTNQALKDTCKRVGGDPKRKFSPMDRLTGASLLCLEQAVKVLGDIAGLEEGHRLYEYILPLYELYAGGAPIEKIRKTAEEIRARELVNII